MIDELKKRIEVAIKFTRLLVSRTDIARVREMQKRYCAERGKITRIDLTDINLSIYFRIRDGKLEIMKNVKQPDNVISAPSDLYFSLFEKEPESVILEAINRWRYGELTMQGETALVDFKLFIRAIKDIKESLPKPQVPQAASV